MLQGYRIISEVLMLNVQLENSMKACLYLDLVLVGARSGGDGVGVGVVGVVGVGVVVGVAPGRASPRGTRLIDRRS